MFLTSRDFSGNDDGYAPSIGNFVIIFFALLFTALCCSALMFYHRRKHRLQKRNALPTYHRRGHQRSTTISTTPTNIRGERVFVYDEKMNLIANSEGPSNCPIPEIHITFPDEQDQSGQTRAGRVVVVTITDSGSIGMEPIRQEALPPYQQSDADRFHSLDLERLGGLREKQPHQWS